MGSCTCCNCNGTPSIPDEFQECNLTITGKTGYGVYARNDNSCPIVLDQSGLTYTGSNGITKNTDGSSKQGFIKLSPEKSGGVDSLLGLAGGKIMRLGDGADHPQGTVIIVKGNQFVLAPLSDIAKVYDPTKMKTGQGKLLALTCASGGFSELAYFATTPNTVIYIDAEGNAKSYTLAQLTESLLVPFCENLPDLGDKELKSLVGCSPDGLVKTTTATTKTYYHEPMVRLYGQVKHQGLGAVNLYPNEVAYFPDLPPAVPGLFVDQITEVDLTKLAGYKENATGVILSVQGACSIQQAVGVELWHMVLVINERERLRLTAGQSVGSWNNANNQFIMQMPTDKKLRIDAQRQVSAPGTPSEVSYATVYLEGFLFN